MALLSWAFNVARVWPGRASGNKRQHVEITVTVSDCTLE
jgi:hypothetical protein